MYQLVWFNRRAKQDILSKFTSMRVPSYKNNVKFETGVGPFHKNRQQMI